MNNREIGVWLDYNSAIIIDNSDLSKTPVEIESNIDPYHVKGGSSSKLPWGSVDTVSESKYLNKRNQQKAKYYTAIAEYLEKGDRLIVFGPAEAKIGFNKYLIENQYNNAIGLNTVKYMTLNQKVAYVRDHFNK